MIDDNRLKLGIIQYMNTVETRHFICANCEKTARGRLIIHDRNKITLVLECSSCNSGTFFTHEIVFGILG